jgi:hypothetical protein
MTNQDKLKQIVQVMIEGGWRKQEKIELGTVYIYIWDEWRVNIIDTHRERQYSLPDLLADASAMKAALGSETIDAGGHRVDSWEKENEDGTTSFGGALVKNTIPASLYHALEALKLIHAGEDAISYLWDNLPKGENNDR